MKIKLWIILKSKAKHKNMQYCYRNSKGITLMRPSSITKQMKVVTKREAHQEAKVKPRKSQRKRLQRNSRKRLRAKMRIQIPMHLPEVKESRGVFKEGNFQLLWVDWTHVEGGRHRWTRSEIPEGVGITVFWVMNLFYRCCEFSWCEKNGREKSKQTHKKRRKKSR